MDRYQKVLKQTIIPKYARTNSDTAPALLAAVRKYAGMIGSALGLAAEHGSPMGAAAGYGVSKLLDKAGEQFLAARQAKKLNQTFSTIVPPPVKACSVSEAEVGSCFAVEPEQCADCEHWCRTCEIAGTSASSSRSEKEETRRGNQPTAMNLRDKL